MFLHTFYPHAILWTDANTHMKKLHPTQEKLLKLLKSNSLEPLTIRELQEELGASSSSVVFHHIQQLEKKGFIKQNPSNPRDYQILAEGPEKQITFLNLYGLAHCGLRGSILDDSPIDRIPISTRLISFPSSEAFMVKAKGNSMEPKINEGDLVIVKKINKSENGSIVVCINDGEALIKKIQEEKQGYILTSLNTQYPPFFAAKDFRIVGEVKGIFSYNLE